MEANLWACLYVFNYILLTVKPALMRSIIALVSLFFISISAFCQNTYVGIKSGASKWSYRGMPYSITDVDMGVFARTEPIKRLAVDASFSKYQLQRDHSGYVPNSNAGDMRQKLRCNEVSVAMQYNYVRLFDDHLKFYAGMDCSPTYVERTAEEYNIRNYRAPITPYRKTEDSFWFYLCGFNHTITYDTGKVSVLVTLFYRGNTSEILLGQPFYPGDIRIGFQGGISYKIF